MKKLFANKWVKFGVVAFLYLLFVIWVQNWWLLLGFVIIYDLYISQKVHWAFWKKKDAEKQTKTVEWIDALIFAVIAATIIRLFSLRRSPYRRPRWRSRCLWATTCLSAS